MQEVIQRKVCPRCNIEKSFGEYNKAKSKKYGLARLCKICNKENLKEYYIKNKQLVLEKSKKYKELNKESIKQYRQTDEYKESIKQYRQTDEYKEKRKQYNKKYRQSEKCKESEKKYRQTETYKQYRYNYFKTKLETDVNFRLGWSLRARIHDAIKNNATEKAYSSIELLGCTVEEVRNHIEKQFKEGMSWENHGELGWHIDHIIPCSSFDLTNPDEQKKCFHYTNLQPMWASQNLSKNDKITLESGEIVRGRDLNKDGAPSRN